MGWQPVARLIIQIKGGKIMKKRSMFLMSFALLLLLVVGGTMAWFTAESGEVVNTFKAGTVKIELHEKTGKYNYENGEYIRPSEEELKLTSTVVEDKGVDMDLVKEGKYLNPGDKYVKEVKVKNIGTKKAYIRVQLTPEWIAPESGWPIDSKTNEAFKPDNQLVNYPILSDWELIEQPKEELWYYYTKIVEPNESTTELIKEVIFPGRDMTNEYQDAGFTLKVKAEAIQASNDAIKDEWKIDPDEWEAITE